MKKTALSALVAASAIVASPAFAQAGGTVEVTGTVAERCTAAAIGGSIPLGELALVDGTVDTSFAGATNGLSRNFTVRCNGANPQLSVLARPLVNNAVQTASAGYTNTVHYTASVAALGAKGATSIVADESLSDGATKNRLGDRLAATANNITLTIGKGVTTDTTAILEAGTYQGSVEILVSPAA